jgi:hypothetical protein
VNIQDLKNALGTVPKGLNLKGFVTSMGYDPDNLTQAQIDEIVAALGSQTQGSLAKNTQRGAVAASVPTPQASAPDTGCAAQDLTDAFRGATAAQDAMVEGFVGAVHNRAAEDAGKMLGAVSAMAPTTLGMVTEGLNAGMQEGYFDPAGFQCLGASLVASNGVPS